LPQNFRQLDNLTLSDFPNNLKTMFRVETTVVMMYGHSSGRNLKDIYGELDNKDRFPFLEQDGWFRYYGPRAKERNQCWTPPGQ